MKVGGRAIAGPCGWNPSSMFPPGSRTWILRIDRSPAPNKPISRNSVSNRL